MKWNTKVKWATQSENKPTKKNSEDWSPGENKQQTSKLEEANSTKAKAPFLERQTKDGVMRTALRTQGGSYIGNAARAPRNLRDGSLNRRGGLFFEKQ